jgi:hypothetical protein
MRQMSRGLLLLAALISTLAVALPASAAEGVTVKGVLASVSSTTVAVKDAKNVITTCALVAKSPSLDGYTAGDRVQAACLRTGGKLVLAKIHRLAVKGDSSSNDAQTTKFGGVITALSDSSISLHDGARDITCAIGASSPSTGGAKVGQHLNVTCANGVLVAIAPVTSGRAYEGTVTAIGATSITVHTPNGDGTCAVGAGSPSVADVKVGDRVLAGCAAGTNQLVLLKKLAPSGSPPPPPPPPGDGHAVTVAGTLSALSSSSLTVHGEHGDVTCTVPATARLGDFHVGDHVGMACVDGALLKLVKLQ